uniref:Uncharacterized protein n=1 Tax=Rhizochromulina marina TaxID=1034831 RepID=A0A7S2SV71_9STRA
MASLYRRAGRFGRSPVRFSLHVKVISITLPPSAVSMGPTFFVTMERGRRVTWTQPQSMDAKDWGEAAVLTLPVTLYRDARGNYQGKPFVLRLRSEVGDEVVAVYALDASAFVFPPGAEVDGRELIAHRISAVTGKGRAPKTQMMVAIRCDFERELGADEDTTTVVSGRTGSDVTQFNEQDLSGFEEVKTSSRFRWFRSQESQPSPTIAEDQEAVTPSLQGPGPREHDPQEVSPKGLSWRRHLPFRSAKYPGLRSAALATSSVFDKEVGALLRTWGLAKYAKEVVAQRGMDELGALTGLQPGGLDRLVASLGMSEDEANVLRLRLGIPPAPNARAQEEASRMAPRSLVGRWVYVQGLGVGKILSFQPVWNHFFHDSHHVIDFTATDDAMDPAVASSRQTNDFSKDRAKLRVLLRRVKLFHWNSGHPFEVTLPPQIPGEGSPRQKALVQRESPR